MFNNQWSLDPLEYGYVFILRYISTSQCIWWYWSLDTSSIQILRVSASRYSNSTLFYHLEKSLYLYTIQFYNTSSIVNFYFTIQHIKIIFLHNKIIYPKTQIKTKTQKPRERERERENKILVFFFLRIELHCNSTFRIAL